MNGSKPWYKSETVWSNIVTIASAVFPALALFNVIPLVTATKIATTIVVIAGAFGIHGRITATTTIGTPASQVAGTEGK